MQISRGSSGSQAEPTEDYPWEQDESWDPEDGRKVAEPNGDARVQVGLENEIPVRKNDHPSQDERYERPHLMLAKAEPCKGDDEEAYYDE